MDRPLPGPTVAALLHDVEPTPPFVTGRSAKALNHLFSAFEEGRPLAVLNSGWRAGSQHVVQKFLAELGDKVSVARVTDACTSEPEGMRELIRSIGLDPKELGVADLRMIFEDFLAFQRKRKRRTIAVLEEPGKNGGWIRDYVGRLVELQMTNKSGLAVILMRQTSFNAVADEPSLDSVSYKAGKHISLTPFTKAETRKFIRWRIKAAATADMGRILDFEAITLIHELCDGMPDAIDRLCCTSLELADNEDTAPVTTDVVMRASQTLQLQPAARQPSVESRFVAAPPDGIPTLEVPKSPRIVLLHNGETIRELPIGQQRISIGRSNENDLCIESPFISRHHAAIFRNGAETAVVDLESKNGTFVNSQRIQVQTISDQDVIKIGHHYLRYYDPDAPRIKSLNRIARKGRAISKDADRARAPKASAKADGARR